MSLVELLPDLRHAGATAGGEYAGPCPWCGGKDRFRMWPEHPSGQAKWWCRRCERSGDGIDLLRELKGMGFREAAAAVGQLVAQRPAAVPSETRQHAPLSPPPAAWRSKSEAVAVEAEAALWRPEGARALAYLRGRGFVDDAVRAARLGYVVKDHRENAQAWGLPADHCDVWVPRGVVIPWWLAGSLWRLNVRRPVGEPKYIGPAGFTNGLYGADGVRGDRPVVLVEGEFDALAVWQEAGDVVAPVATGSTCGGRHARWRRLLASAPLALVAYDEDEAGESAAAHWLAALPGSRRLVPEGDPAGMLEAGADVRQWVREELQ